MDMTPPEVIQPPAMPQLSGSPLSAKVIAVTPEMAEKWLTRNHPSNRPIQWRVVEAYANDMRSGNWRLTHQSIAFDAQGYLIDGQHRLKAIAQSACVVTLLVVENQIGTFHDPIDRVRPRSIATILGIGQREAACANVLRMLEAGCLLDVPMTLADAEAVLDRHRAASDEIAKVPGKAKLSGVALGACVFAHPCEPKRTALFAEQLASGELIRRGDPAFALRNWFASPGGRSTSRTWPRAMAVLTCLRYALTNTPMSSVYTTTWGYRAICSRRRAMKVPHTPGPDLVPAGHWTPQKNEREEMPPDEPAQ